MEPYDPRAIEPKWQQVWEEAEAFSVPNPDPGTPPNPDKRYVLEQLPYPSGTLHMGHMLVYTIGDVRAHFQRRTGHEVMRPMGWDSFGLPAENAAIRGGGHPREMTERNIDHIRAFMKRAGWAIDWDREIAAHSPDYYRWTQWLFLKLYEAGLAYRKAVAGELVPERPDRSGERAGQGRPLRALRGGSRGPEPGAVVLPHDRLCRRAARLRGRCSGPSGSSPCSGTGSAAPRAPS